MNIESSSSLLRATRPGTDEITWEGPVTSPSEIDNRVTAARVALPGWRALPAEERIAIARRFAARALEREDQLAASISDETGKPKWEARSEAKLIPAKVTLSIQAFEERTGGKSVDLAQGIGRVAYRPTGVLAVLGPFNFPAHLPNGHIVPALVAGNTVIFKPSEHTPGTGELLCSLWRDAGLPDSVLQCVQGERETGAAMVAADVDGVLFTGSEAGGRAIHRSLGGRPEVLLALEMGGNNPLIIDGANDLEAAAYTTVVSAYISAGQRCTCARRLILTGSVDVDGLLDQIVQMMKRLRVGLPDESPQPFMGPLISPKAASQVLAEQADRINRGATPLVPSAACGSNPALLRPGLLDVTEMKNRRDEEVFGPLLQLTRVKDLDEAIGEANQTRYGLSASLLSQDPDAFDRFRKQIRAGVINWNQPTIGASGRLPFGGVGASGNHRPSGFFAADYCSDATAILETPHLNLPEKRMPGMDQNS